MTMFGENITWVVSALITYSKQYILPIFSDYFIRYTHYALIYCVFRYSISVGVSYVALHLCCTLC